MIGEKHCPFCKTTSRLGCGHLALAAEARDFVRRCVESCHGQRPFRALCAERLKQRRLSGNWTPDREDFLWLETAFCDEFLKGKIWFGGLDYEWRPGPRPEQGGFWVLLWSKDPQRLWWDLRDEFERQSGKAAAPSRAAAGLATPTPMPSLTPLKQ